VKLRLIATNRRVDLIEERIDVAIRVRTKLDDDASLIMRNLRQSYRILACAPSLIERLGPIDNLDDLARVPTLTMSESVDHDRWDLVGPSAEARSVAHEPRLASGDLAMLRDAAIEGLGVALLPDHICAPALRSGHLVRILPGWSAPVGIIHLVFTARRGLPPVVRALIDHLVRNIAGKPEPSAAETSALG
jgi:DNA-binding transcriptional LysR family regulator